MKKLLVSLLTCSIFTGIFAQDPLEPCCSIMAVDAVNNIVTARDNKTGRIYQFKADLMDMRGLQKGDAINIADNKISAINGSLRSYVTLRPNYLEPCCAVISIRVDGIEPCCSDVTIRNNSTNKKFTISIPKGIADPVKIGDPVYVEPCCNMAVVQSVQGGEIGVYGYTMTALADNKNDQEPCCSILSTNMANNTALARDNTTGRLYKFNGNAAEIKTIKKGDAATISANKVSAINGSLKNYSTFKPDYSEPCCAVVSVQLDGVEPCCGLIMAKNNSTGATIQFKAPKFVASTVKIGDPAYAEPCCGMAVVQSSYQSSNGQMNSFGYPIESGSGNSGETAAEKWVVNKQNKKLSTGRLFVTLPREASWDMTIYNSGSNKVLSNTMLKTSFNLLPGKYDLEINKIRITGVPVEKGNETRLKAGVLRIASGSWTLYDESKQKVLINSMDGQTRGLPAGKYKLTLMGQDIDIEIKDGQTLEF